MSFSSFSLNANLLKAVQNMGFDRPTPIQRLAVPPLLEGRDVMASAVTGSGKTAAFLLPILHRLMEKPRGTTRALILAPTRELAAQISEHLHDLAAHTPLKGAAVYGGVSMGPQEAAFRRGVDVLIATPGRLLDHCQYPYARLHGIEHLVLDEADRMLDMGFLPDIRRILHHVPKQRQTLLFSATLPAPIVELAKDMLQNPVSLNIERKSAPAAGITHVAYPVPHELKSALFLELVKNSPSKHVLAFTRTKHRANRLADFLEKHGVTCERIHGNRSQAQRTDALASFKKGRCRVLVATDVAARGIDVEALGLVVNFDVPQLSEDYIHRVGRTGRVNATGDAYTLVSPNEEENLRAIERAIGTRLPRQKVPGFNYAHAPAERFEVPLAERIAAIRARKAEERVRAKANAARRATHGITVGPAGNGTAGQNPRSNRSASPSRWAGKPVTGKSFSRPVSGRLNGGRADWRSNGSTTEPRSARRA
ncbi:MAG: DEAD/DEAH box helicase [candidate division NC10 bacterium]|nr:DEAD/DEAH box helicase [candidate division NC10 bacterium]